MTIHDDQHPLSVAAAIVSNVPGSFAWGVLTRRHPDLIAAVRRVMPYPPAIQESLDELLPPHPGIDLVDTHRTRAHDLIAS